MNLDSFFGRDAELAELRAWVRGEERLLTISGAGGVGKTRLICELAAREGLVVVDLAGARVWSEVVVAVGRALELPLTRGASPARLLDALGPTVLVLDNLEQLVGVIREPLMEWLGVAQRLRLITTSRRRIGVPGERILPIGPLREEGVALFVDRARRVRPGFDPDEAALEEVAALVGALDALPLAIELAAARVAVLDPAAILERLGARFALLDRGQARGLRATLEWSWSHLDELHQSVLGACAHFRGGFELEAAVAVTGCDELAVIEALHGLVEHSMLQVSHAGRSRYAMYESVREYALESAPQEAAPLAHARYFGVAALARVELGHSDDPVEWLERERDNLQAVVDRGLEQPAGGDWEVAVGAALGLNRIMVVRDPPAAILAFLTRVQAWSALPAEAPGRAGLCLAECIAHRLCGDEGAARRCAESLKDGPFAARGEVQLISLDLRGAEPIAPAQGHARLLATLEALEHDGAYRGFALGLLAQVSERLGDLEGAREGYRAAQAQLQAVGFTRFELMAAGREAAVIARLGEEAAAEAVYRQALARLRGIARPHFDPQLATVLSARSYASAEDFFDRAVEVVQPIGLRRFEGLCVGCIAELRVARGEPSAEDFAEAAAILESIGDAPSAAHFRARLQARPALEVIDEGRRLGLPEGGEIDLRRSHTGRRVVLALVAQREAHPGVSLGAEALLLAGWPEERVDPFAALNRLHVMLNSLRKKGLRDLILSDEAGWHLDPEVPVRRREG